MTRSGSPSQADSKSPSAPRSRAWLKCFMALLDSEAGAAGEAPGMLLSIRRGASGNGGRWGLAAALHQRIRRRRQLTTHRRDDIGRDDDDQLRLVSLELVGFEQIAQDRDVAQPRDGAVADLRIARDQPGDGEALPAAQLDRRVGLAR